MGVGKTAACQKLKKQLHNSVFLDGDWCWDAEPFQVTDETKVMVMDNISYLLNNFIRCSAYENVIFCWVLHEQAIIDTLLSKLDLNDCTVRNVSLVCTERTLRKRLQTDVTSGARSEDVFERSCQRIKLYDRLTTIKLSVDDMSIDEVASAIATV